MSENIENEVKLDAVESDDGSAVVELDAKLLEPEASEEQNGFERAQEAQEPVDSADEDHEDDDEELRNAKRNRRRAKKDLIRKTNQEKDIRLQQLQRENEEFKQRLSQLERNTKAEGLVRIDKSLDDANVRVEYAKMKMIEATNNGDGQALVEAQTLWNAAQDEVKQLSQMRKQADKELRQPINQNRAPDPQVQRKASEWIKRNNWYDPQLGDPDSKVAKKMDELMAAQGWDPSDPDYWDELDSRLQKELPHRYNSDNDDDSRNVRRPRNVVASSGREASSAYGGSNRSQFVLSPERVRAMKEAGAWDNPERKAKMIANFIAFDRQNRN
jgi:hypothetical protein